MTRANDAMLGNARHILPPRRRWRHNHCVESVQSPLYWHTELEHSFRTPYLDRLHVWVNVE